MTQQNDATAWDDVEETPEETSLINQSLADHRDQQTRKLRRPELIADELRCFAERITKLATMAECLTAFHEHDSRNTVAQQIEVGVDDIGYDLHEFSVTYDPAVDE